MSPHFDLSGDWHYPDGSSPVPFEAAIRENSGSVVGTIREVDAMFDVGMVLEAVIEGGRHQRSVCFTKYYESGDESYDTVFYSGELNDDGTEIRGRWEVPGTWSGGFVMIRPKSAVVEMSTQRAETVR